MIQKREMAMKNVFSEEGDIYMCLTWKATERNWKLAAAQQDAARKAKQRTEHQALQRAVRHALELRNSNALWKKCLQRKILKCCSLCNIRDFPQIVLQRTLPSKQIVNTIFLVSVQNPYRIFQAILPARPIF